MLRLNDAGQVHSGAMLSKVAGFEFRYQVKSPLFKAVAVLLFLAAFVDMSVAKLATSGGGNVLFNSPHSIIMSHVIASLVFLFVGAAFVSNVIVRDDQTAFGPIIRSTRITKADYLFGRFIGAFAVGALVMATVTLGAWLGTLMPFADQEMLGPNRLSGFAYGYGLFALPNALIISAILFALATTTRSTAGTFIGVIGFLFLYLFAQRLMENQPQLLNFRVLADPLGATAYIASSRYLTAAELNAGAVPVTGLMLLSRLLWIGVAIALLALSYFRFRFSDRGMSRRQRRKLKQRQAMEAHSEALPGTPLARLAEPRFGGRTFYLQFIARAAMEARFIFKSPAFLILLLLAFAVTLPSLLIASDMFGTSFYPLAALTVPDIEQIFRTILIVIATYYGGELVWRDRERKMHEIIDATPLAEWGLMLPKMVGLALVLFTTLLVGMAAGLLVQLLDGGVDAAPGEYLLWYLLPGAVDALLVAALAVFVAALSPSKYIGWGVMVLYIILSIFGPSMGREYPLFIYGNVPSVPLSDMAGTGNFGTAAWWFRLFWAATAVLLLIVVHLLWPRGAEQRLKPRLRRITGRLTGRTGLAALAALAVFVLSGSWIVYNTLILNAFRTGDEQQYLAEYEKRFFGYAQLPQPVVKHVDLDVDLYPRETRAEVSGRYRLVNETAAPVERVHVRLMNRDLKLVGLDFPGARLERNDEAFGYRIYRLARPMRPGEARTIAFRTRREQIGFRASGTETGIAANGTDLNSLELTPRIGMSDVGLIEDPAARRQYGLPERQPFPRLDDLAATKITPNGDLSWTTADITVSTVADQTPIAPGKKVSEGIGEGRRTARFVSDMPIKNFFSIQSGRYALARQVHGGIEHSVYFHPAHRWNVDRMMKAMRTSIDYYGKAFGPYQFDQVRIVETPAYRRGGGQSFPNTIAVGEPVFAWDIRDPQAFDMVSMLTAHELAHQWWGHQVTAARMQGAGFLSESLAQYSALMVMKKLQGEERIRPFLQFQLDRYLSGRRTQVLTEQPLIRAGLDQDYVNYGKGALALYLLQQRIGEQAVNRALRRLVDRYRFTVAPYPRSLDLVAYLRQEAKRPEDQALITDLFERIAIYDLKVEAPSAVRRADGRWDVTVPVEARKFYASGTGGEKEATLGDLIEIGLFTAEPGGSAFGRKDVLRMERQKVRSGRQVFRFVTDAKPTHAGIDPYNFYIDRNSGDNVAPVKG